jgi:hypothetical protein
MLGRALAFLTTQVTLAGGLEIGWPSRADGKGCCSGNALAARPKTWPAWRKTGPRGGQQGGREAAGVRRARGGAGAVRSSGRWCR